MIQNTNSCELMKKYSTTIFFQKQLLQSSLFEALSKGVTKNTVPTVSILRSVPESIPREVPQGNSGSIPRGLPKAFQKYFPKRSPKHSLMDCPRRFRRYFTRHYVFFSMIALHIWDTNKILTIKINKNNTKSGREQNSFLLLLVNKKVESNILSHMNFNKKRYVSIS